MIKAIIVDDEPAVYNIIRHFIDKENMPIELAGAAENGGQALALMEQVNPGLVFLDIQMPGMSGFEVMEQAPDRHYIIITAYESFQYAQQALRLGAKDILLKPIEYRQFHQAITRAVGWQFTHNPTVNSILEYIHTNYSEKIELQALAQRMYSTPSHIARLFKKHMGVSIISYSNRVRIEKAAALLSEGKHSVKEVALLTGYDSLNNFYKYFKLYLDMTPAAYCQQNREED